MSEMLPAQRAVDAYLDELLTEAPPQAPLPVDAPSWPPAASDYLLCVAGGVRIAMPMAQVEDMLPAPLAGSEALYAGHPRHGDQRLRVVELAPILAADLVEPAADMLVVLSGRRWALACRIEEDPLRIASSEVDWRVGRTERQARPWLGGMHKDRRCAVLDVAALLDMLDQAPPMPTPAPSAYQGYPR
jgi:hypothetical protein